MASRAVIQQQKTATAIGAASEAHAEAAAKATEALLAPHLKKGETMPDVALLVRLTGRLLAESTAQLVAADTAHEKELADDLEPRQRRDDAAQHIYDRLLDLRDAITGVYGDNPAEEGGLHDRIPKEPVLLSRYASKVVEALPAVKLPAPRLKGAKLDLRESIAEIEANLPVLEVSLRDVAREAREAEQTLSAKQAAMTQQSHHSSGVASLLSGVFRLAGLDDLADRVRPTTRRSSAAEAPPATPPAPATPAK